MNETPPPTLPLPLSPLVNLILPHSCFQSSLIHCFTIEYYFTSSHLDDSLQISTFPPQQMKTRSSTLSPSLTSLQDSLSSLKSLSTQLNIPPGGDSSIVGQTSTPISSSSTSTDQERQRQILLKEIRPILILPQRLSDLIILRKANESSNLQIDPKTNEFGGESTIKMEEFQDPKELYLKYKDTILDWEKVGIKGAREIREDCEEVLKGC